MKGRMMRERRKERREKKGRAKGDLCLIMEGRRNEKGRGRSQSF